MWMTFISAVGRLKQYFCCNTTQIARSLILEPVAHTPTHSPLPPHSRPFSSVFAPHSLPPPHVVPTSTTMAIATHEQAPSLVRILGVRRLRTRTSLPSAAPTEQTRSWPRSFSTRAIPRVRDRALFKAPVRTLPLLLSHGQMGTHMHPRARPNKHARTDKQTHTHTHTHTAYTLHTHARTYTHKLTHLHAHTHTHAHPWTRTHARTDWCGGAREAVEKATSAPCLCLQGFCGDLNPILHRAGCVPLHLYCS